VVKFVRTTLISRQLHAFASWSYSRTIRSRSGALIWKVAAIADYGIYQLMNFPML